jgi:tetratricopeptide (TPR) repeat protein
MDGHVDKSDGNKLAQEGLRLWQSGQRLQALEWYNLAIDLSPEDSILLLNRAQLQVELGNVTEALCDFEKARAGHPPLPEHLFIMQEGLQSMSPEALRIFLQKVRETR